MTTEKEAKLEDFIAELDKKSPQELLTILLEPRMHEDIRFAAVNRPHMNRESADRACELIAQNRKEKATARVMALRSLSSKEKADKMAQAMVLDKSETHELREEALFYYPHAFDTAAGLLDKIVSDKTENAWFRGTLAGTFTRYAIQEGIVEAKDVFPFSLMA